jgi:hypothetical protein
MRLVSIAVIFSTLLCLSLRADDSSPYVSIVARNIFSLVPMPTNNPAEQTQPDPPAKITPNGIMTLFGQLQVLFKVATPPKPGQPPQDQSYVMSEGDRQDGIAVTKIDGQAGMITFDNHGVIQKLGLTAATDVSTPAAPPGGSMAPGMRRFGGRLGQPRNPNNPFGGNGNNPGSYNSPSANNSMPASAMPSYQANQISPEAQALLIEKNRIDTQEQVNQGLMPPLPPTAITPPVP